MAWGKTFVFGLLRVNLTVSPSVTRTTGPGNWPLKVQALYFIPPPSTISSDSTAVILTSWVLAEAGSMIKVILPNTITDSAATNEKQPLGRLCANNMLFLLASKLVEIGWMGKEV